jgi:hypothetical protein
MAQNLKRRTHPIKGMNVADDVEERQLKLLYEEQAWELKERKLKFLWELKERKMKLFFTFSLITLLLAFWVVVLFTSPAWSAILGAGTVLAYALRVALSGIFKKSEDASAPEMKSRIRLWAARKIAGRLSSRLEEDDEDCSVEKHLPRNNDDSRD